MKGNQALSDWTPKRVARACNYCRRRKIRCNGKSICGSCTDLGIECSYEYSAKPIRRAQRSLIKEESLGEDDHRQTLSPSDSQYESQSQSGDISSRASSRAADNHTPDSAISMGYDAPSRCLSDVTSPSTPAGDYATLETIHAGLDQDFSYNERLPEPRGGSSGIEVLRRIRSLCDILVESGGSNCSSYEIANTLDQSFPRHLLPTYSIANVPLPSKPELARLIHVALSKSLRLKPFIDRALVEDILDRLHTFGGSRGVEADELTLIYSLAALGQRHDSGLQPSGGDSVATGMVNGLGLFGAAQQRIKTIHGQLSLIKIQAVLCLAFFLVSASAKKMARTYISLAAEGIARLDEILSDSGHKVRKSNSTSRTWTYIALKELDMYISASLGLPRIVSTNEVFIGPTDAPEHGTNEDLAVANARNHLFEILGAMLKTYHDGQNSALRSTYTMSEKRILEFEEKLERWEQLHPLVLQDKYTADTSSTQLSLRYDRCWAELIAYSPFIHYALRLKSGMAAAELAIVMKATQAAVRAVETAELIRQHTGLKDIEPSMIEALAIAAEVLLVVELSMPSSMAFPETRRANTMAHQLLEYLAIRGHAAARGCLHSLEPLYARTIALSRQWP